MSLWQAGRAGKYRLTNLMERSGLAADCRQFSRDGSSFEPTCDFVHNIAAGALHRRPITVKANSRRNRCPANRLNIDASFPRLID
jgi:hypothetical protein